MKGILAILMAGIMMAAMIAPAMSSTDTSATVGNVAPVVGSVVVTDPTLMNLCPTTTDVTVTATVSDANGRDDIASVQITNITPAITGIGVINMTLSTNNSATEAVYVGTISLPCCTEPGSDKYNITVTATDNGPLSDTGTDLLTVPGSTGLSINFDKVSFGPAAPNTNNVSGNATLNSSSVGSPVASSIGNTVINVSVGAGNLTGTSHGETITGDNMEANLADDPDAGWLVVGWSPPPQTFITNLVCGGTPAATAFRLDIPNVKPDTYTGILTISAV